MWQRPARLSTLLILVALFCYATSIRDGHDWSGDHAQYILHAQALLQGHPYAPPPGYIHNPYLSWTTPAYPVAYPIAIAIAMAIFGLNFIVLKFQVVCFFVAGLWAYWLLSKKILPPWAALGALSVVAFSPYYLKFSNKVLSDIPYLSVSVFAVLAAQFFFDKRPSLYRASGLTALLILSLCFRTAGVALVFAVPAYALFFKRSHLIAALLIAVASMGALTLISWNLVGFYLNQTDAHPERIIAWFWGNLQSFPFHLMRFLALYPKLDTPMGDLINYGLSTACLVLCALGIFYRMRTRKLAYWDVYVAFYLGMILAYSLLRTRYLIPLIPFLILYATIGLRVFSTSTYRWIKQKNKWRPPYRRFYRWAFFIPAFIYAPLFAAYWMHYTFWPATPEANMLKIPEVQALFAEIKSPKYNITGAIFDRPRVLTLFTGIPATTCFNADLYWQQTVTWDLPKLLDLSQQGNISHLILDQNQSATYKALSHIVEAHPEHFLHVYHNAEYDMYHIRVSPQLSSGN